MALAPGVLAGGGTSVPTMTTTQPISLVRARLITPVSLAVRLSAVAAAALGLFMM